MSSSFTVTRCRRHWDSTITFSDRRRAVIAFICPSNRQNAEHDMQRVPMALDSAAEVSRL